MSFLTPFGTWGAKWTDLGVRNEPNFLNLSFERLQGTRNGANNANDHFLGAKLASARSENSRGSVLPSVHFVPLVPGGKK